MLNIKAFAVSTPKLKGGMDLALIWDGGDKMKTRVKLSVHLAMVLLIATGSYSLGKKLSAHSLSETVVRIDEFAGVIDRFEGENAVVTMASNFSWIVPRSILPSHYKEGEFISIRFEACEQRFTAQRSKITSLQEELLHGTEHAAQVEPPSSLADLLDTNSKRVLLATSRGARDQDISYVGDLVP